MLTLHRRRGPARERGSVLLLFPAAILVVLLLASIAVDAAIAHRAQVELREAAAAAANDAVTHGLDEATFQRTGEWRLDPRRVEAAVRAALAARADHLDATLAGAPTIDPATGAVTVTLTAEVDYLFAPAVSARSGTAVRAAATAVPLMSGP